MKNKKSRLELILENLPIGEIYREQANEGDPRIESVFKKLSEFQIRHWFERKRDDGTIQICMPSDIWID